MMKWLIRIYLLAVLALMISCGVVEAASIDTVTITAEPNYPLAPTNFKTTYVSETQVNLTWVKGANSTQTLIIAKIGSYPTSMTDGYQVYLGTGLNTSDTGVNFEVIGGDVYYAAWGISSTKYSSNFAQATIGGKSMGELAEKLLGLNISLNNIMTVFGGFVYLVPLVVFSILAFWKENAILFMIAAGVAMMTGLHCPDILGGSYSSTPLGISVGLMLIAYSLLCCGWAFRLMFWKEA